MQIRRGTAERVTKETEIRITLTPDGTGEADVQTGIGFFDHMLTAWARHGGFDLEVRASGDLHVDPHHTIEDTGIVLGMALKEATGDGKGITRFSHTGVPMDEAIAYATLDIGGRGYLVYNGKFSSSLPGGIAPDLIEHFFFSLCTHAGITAHLYFEGRNDHHKCEALFKAFGVAMRAALRYNPSEKGVPSTKGVI